MPGNNFMNVTTVKKLVIPGQYLAFVGDVTGKHASLYRSLFPCCVKKKDGSDKLLIVPRCSRHNAKKHFLCFPYSQKDDLTQELGHKNLWDPYSRFLPSDVRIMAEHPLDIHVLNG
ncbi:hypothetical protein OUZ56_011590 [Daphnia magna]|uniref:Uncharacterized protein n=1 Tax=Daphnia magna TaxID=35525 RepID=A0ABQ9Z0J5_9CRUS|nr:hypothetical protein OUZ56_011590 [Daphnia magna]